MLAAVAAVLTAVVVVVRADGFEAVDATVPRATRWFVGGADQQIVLVDGFAGRPLARLATDAGAGALELAQSAGAVVLVDRNAGSVRSVDAVNLRLGPPQPVGLVGVTASEISVGQAGLVVVDPATADAVVVPPGGEALPFDVGAAGAGDQTQIAIDGAVWTIASGRLSRITSASEQVLASGLSDARFTLVGNRPLLLDASRRRVRFDGGDWIALPADVDASEIVLQTSGPRAECGWIVANDDLWCIAADGVAERRTIAGLDADGADRFAVAGDAAALVRRAPAEIVRIDWRAGVVLDDVVADVPAGGDLTVSTSTDLVWIDQTDGNTVWAINPWGINAIAKNDVSAPLLGATGELIEEGTGTEVGGRDADRDGEIEREPDDNGIDDPPRAIDDRVTARTGAQIQVPVTANDYDPDGEAIALVAVGEAPSGTVEIVSATTVAYQPDSGFVGSERFEYTIADGNGTEDTAEVIIELLPIDATNQAPIGTPDAAETGPGASVIVDVLLNDVDPERDPLRIGSFTPPEVGGTVQEVPAPSGLQGLEFVPDGRSSGTVTFTYRPIDALGAEGEPVTVSVDIAQPTDDNRPPITRPDAVRVRRGTEFPLSVLANDRDPDGDRLVLTVPDPLPAGLDVVVAGNDLLITATAGSAPLVPFTYLVDDGNGHEVVGSVLVAVIAEVEPNRPPIANADAASAVVGTTQLIDVLANDSDPDNDPLTVVDVRSETGATVAVQGDRVRYTTPDDTGDDEVRLDRFSYTISDGNGHSADGEVTVRVLPELLAEPPFAQDDAATTVVDVPVTLDVLRNDGDPSGEPPSLLGPPGCAGVGVATVTDSSKVTYTPPAGRSGVFSCTYTVVNSQGLQATATIVISVVEPQITNQKPIAGPDVAEAVFGEQVSVDVLANDIDPETGSNEGLAVLSSTSPFRGTAIREGSTISYTASDVPGPVVINYRVGDQDGGEAQGTLTVLVREPDPVGPIALDDQRTIIGPGSQTSVNVLDNDDDPDGDAADLRITAVEVIGGQGTVTSGTGLLTFLPDPDLVGDLTARYTITDPDGLTATARATLTVLEPPNTPPVANDDSAEVVNGGTVTIAIAFNDVDPDDDVLTYSLVQPPDASLGTATIGEGTLSFSAVPGADGTAIMTYRLDDGEAASEATVRVNVLPCAVAPPEAPNVSFRTGYEQPIAIDLTAYARNGEIVEVGAPLGVPAGVYTPPAGENGNVSFTYTVRNSCRLQATGVVVIDVNQDPIAAAYEADIGRIDPTTILVSSLATDAEPLRIVALEGAPTWVALVDEQRAIRIVPAGQSGRLDMVAVVADPGGLQARVPIGIDLINLAPTAVADDAGVVTGAVTIAPLANDVDPDGDAISLGDVPTSITFPNGGQGTVERLGNGELRIDPQTGFGRATFAYTIVDALGATSQPATIAVTANAPPVADDMTVTVPAGSATTVRLAATDPEGGPLTAVLGEESVAPFSVVLTGLDLEITAPSAEGTTRSVTYTVTDDRGATATGTVTMIIGPPPTTTTVPPATTTTVPTTSTTTTTVPTTVPTTTTTTTRRRPRRRACPISRDQLRRMRSGWSALVRQRPVSQSNFQPCRVHTSTSPSPVGSISPNTDRSALRCGQRRCTT